MESRIAGELDELKAKSGVRKARTLALDALTTGLSHKSKTPELYPREYFLRCS